MIRCLRGGSKYAESASSTCPLEVYLPHRLGGRITVATVLESRGPREGAEERFFFTMACAMSAIIVAGFAVNLAMGRSTFAVPPVYHVHAFIFFGWVALYMAQNWLIASDRADLHRRLGWLSVIWVPAMVVIGTALIVVSMRRTGGPFFFDQNEFLFSNPLLLLCFAGLVAAAVIMRRSTAWHRRFMFVGMAILTGPGFGRLLPMPLMIPHAWRIMMVVSMIFPVIGIVHDRIRHGRIHPAWIYGVVAVFATQVIADVIAYSDWGVELTRSVLAGSPGAARPMEAFLPPGF